MRQLDQKNRDFYRSLTDDERKKFSNYLMIRWSSAVSGDRELQEYYVQSCNHYLNHDFFSVNRHPQLQWLMATAVSPGLGAQDHSWIKPQAKSKASGSQKQLENLYPNLKTSDIQLLVKINTQQEIKTHVIDHGIDSKDK
jgi:hypothetical protein